MVSFLIALGVLVIGYNGYGRMVEMIFGPDDRKTPAYEINDGVDFIPMPTWKALLIQLLNIAGTGPIFGAIMGACFGPIVFFWIVLGAIFGGAVHDFMCGMISERHNGASISELSGIYMNKVVLYIMRVFSLILLILTGTVFVTSPAALIARITPDFLTESFWVVLILIYYLIATLLPIDKVIGKLYPIFAVVLIIMAFAIAGGTLFSKQYHLQEISLVNMHPDGLPVWPYMFVTVACGAISGFHATQSPMMSKCIISERRGRRVFYGAMIIESVIALVWAAGGLAFYGNTTDLNSAIATLGQSGTVYDISSTMLKGVGGLLAIIGVVVCPITSGDTAFRSARLILAEWTGLDQKSIKKRLILTIPLLLIGAVLTQLDFNVLWRYFSWSNQTLAMIALWIATSYLIKNGKRRFDSLITALPATFMSAVSMTYFMMGKECLGMSKTIGYPIGIIFAAALFIVYLRINAKQWSN
ncbi:carbon starvation CstA family protein [Butyrivibrio sp. WCE2006]|uniref:carbon starvation CstA family protein n=1 Tax=Butyrivibrio sp. WCE2006 TaxID=1410611 RepID=UPI0005D28A01|nr:carbon starvation CstA family protein [Butyrivibrio sp. WCE2006]